MRYAFLFIGLIWMTSGMGQSKDLKHARNLYQFASSQKDSAEALFALLENRDFEQNQTLRAYQGAAFTIMADYYFLPMDKLRNFKIGKSLIELALAKEPDNWELHYIRYTVQEGCPFFLGYSSNMEADKQRVIAHLNTVGQSGKMSFIERKAGEYLLQSKNVTAEERVKIKSLIVFN